jgi:hypothetical protein
MNSMMAEQKRERRGEQQMKTAGCHQGARTAAERTARRRAQWRAYSASAKGRARSAVYEASPKGRARVAKYRDTVLGMFARAKSSVNSSAASHADRLEGLKMLGDTPGFEWVKDILTRVFEPNGDAHVD